MERKAARLFGLFKICTQLQLYLLVISVRSLQADNQLDAMKLMCVVLCANKLVALTSVITVFAVVILCTCAHDVAQLFVAGRQFTDFYEI